MQFITKVTVTGADDSVHIPSLLDLAEEYPFVEFGILLSKTAMGRSRFPSADWIKTLVDSYLDRHYSGEGINFSGHVCGAWVRQFMMGGWPKWELFQIHEKLFGIFRRFQINTHAEPHDVNWIQLPFLLREFERAGKTIIFQCDNVNGEVTIDRMTAEGITNVAGLFDLSHGAGILPETWPQPIKGVSCGYAGGLSPSNVAGQIEKISGIVGNNTVWIDAETHLYTHAERGERPLFDLDKVRAFLEAAKPWVIQAPKASP